MTNEPLSFDGQEFSHVQATLDHLAQHLDACIYIEDTAGRLLYSSSETCPDSWRADFRPFALALHPKQSTLLHTWRRKAQRYQPQNVVLADTEAHVLIPLTYRDRIFAFIHVVSTRRDDVLERFLDDEFMKLVADKVYIVLMGAINITRKQYLAVEDDQTFMQQVADESLGQDSNYQVLFLHYTDMEYVDFLSSIIDYTSIAIRHTKRIYKHALAETIAAIGGNHHLFHRRQDLIKTIILLEYPAGATTVIKPDTFQKPYAAGATLHVPIAIGPVFQHLHEIPDRIRQAEQILSLGMKNNAEQSIFTTEDIGLEALLWPLSTSLQVRDYTHQLLKPFMGPDTTLLDTLITYIHQDCSAAKTAEILVVDRRTVSYRLERISGQLGLDLGNLKNRFLIYLALFTHGYLD